MVNIDHLQLRNPKIILQIYSFLPYCKVTGHFMEILIYLMFQPVLHIPAVNFLSQNLEIKSYGSNSFHGFTPFFCNILPSKLRFLDYNLHRFFSELSYLYKGITK